MKFFLPSNDLHLNKSLLAFSQQSVLSYIKSMKKMEIHFTEDTLLNEQKFDFIFHELQKLAFADDYNEVIIIHLDNQINFKGIVKLMNYSAIVGLKRYALFNDTFYFIGTNAETHNLNKKYKAFINDAPTM